MAKGVYSLIIRVEKPLTVKVGALGVRRFEAGLYVYVGSALGSAAQSLEGRLNRHLSKFKKARWHIDYLLSNPYVSVERVVLSKTSNRVECSIAKEVAKLGLHSPMLKGFGSSDCRSRCFSHLTYLGSLITLEEAVSEVLKAHRKLSLNPKALDSEDLRNNIL